MLGKIVSITMLGDGEPNSFRERLSKIIKEGQSKGFFVEFQYQVSNGDYTAVISYREQELSYVGKSV